MDRPTIPPSLIRRSPSPPLTGCRDGSSDSNKTTMSDGRRRLKKERETNIESLPDELLIDILVRFPPDFLHDKARLVCRRWSHIIRSDVFINTHFRQHSTYGLVLSLHSKYARPHSIYARATQGGRVETSELPSYINMPTSCNGLTLELHNINELHVVNPLTKQSLRLPSVSRHYKNVYYYQSGIAYSAASVKYKVTLPVQNGLHIVTVGVDKSWRRVVIPPQFLLAHVFGSCFAPLSSEGFLHWASGRYCLTLNVETEIVTMSEVPSPPDHDQHYYRYSYFYLSTGRHLTLLIGRSDFSWEVWEMKPAESGEWRKAAGLRKIARKFRLNPIGWVKYPEVLAFSSYLSKCILFYNLETQEIMTTDLPQQYSFYNRAFVHVISLAWLSQD